MPRLALAFFVVALIAVVLGFGGIGAAAGIAEVLFWVFAVLVLVSLVVHVSGGGKRVDA